MKRKTPFCNLNWRSRRQRPALPHLFHCFRPDLEWLEDRITPSNDTLATAFSLAPDASHQAQAIGALATGNQVDLYAVALKAGDNAKVEVDAQVISSGLNAFLRVFDASGRQVSFNDDLIGTDPGLSFHAFTSGTYYVGVSSSGNDFYDPNQTGSDLTGATTGYYTLKLTVSPNSPTMLNVATPLTFDGSGNAQASSQIVNVNQVSFYSVQLNAEDAVTATIAAQSLGSSLDSYTAATPVFPFTPVPADFRGPCPRR